MIDLKRLLSLLLALCLCLTSFASAELVSDEEPDEDTSSESLDEDEEEDDLSMFAFDEESEAELSALNEQWEIDTSVDPSKLDLNPNLPDHVVNILLIGIDTRSKKMDAGMQRGDVQIILSVNTEDGSIKLTSVMRDLYVAIPGYKSKARINTAYSKGGGKLAMRTLNNLLELNIQNYVTINFFGLASIIDAVGGIDIELTKTEAAAINAYLKKHPPAYDNKAKGERVPLEKVAGVQHLDGVQAVMYARLREIDNDFARTARQRHLLELLLKKIMEDMDMEMLMRLVSISMEYVETNMSMESIVRLAVSVMPALMSKSKEGGAMLQQMRIPMGDGKDATWKYSREDGSSVIVFRTVARRKENVQALHEFIYGAYTPAE